jgi:hypothetical protein
MLLEFGREQFAPHFIDLAELSLLRRNPFGQKLLSYLAQTHGSIGAVGWTSSPVFEGILYLFDLVHHAPSMETATLLRSANIRYPKLIGIMT